MCSLQSLYDNVVSVVRHGQDMRQVCSLQTLHDSAVSVVRHEQGIKQHVLGDKLCFRCVVGRDRSVVIVVLHGQDMTGNRYTCC